MDQLKDLNGRHGGNLDFKLENYMLESPVCLSFLNLARVLNVGERRRGEWQMLGGHWEPGLSRAARMG